MIVEGEVTGEEQLGILDLFISLPEIESSNQGLHN